MTASLNHIITYTTQIYNTVTVFEVTWRILQGQTCIYIRMCLIKSLYFHTCLFRLFLYGCHGHKLRFPYATPHVTTCLCVTALTHMARFVVTGTSNCPPCRKIILIYYHTTVWMSLTFKTWFASIIMCSVYGWKSLNTTHENLWCRTHLCRELWAIVSHTLIHHRPLNTSFSK